MLSATSLGLVADPTAPRLLAHQGGWDEVLLVVGPLALVAGLLWLANRRVSAQLQAAEAEAGADHRPEAADDLVEDDPVADDPAVEAEGDVEGSPETDTRY